MTELWAETPKKKWTVHSSKKAVLGGKFDFPRIFFKAKDKIWTAKTPFELDKCSDEIRQKGKEYKTFISNRQKIFNKNLHKNLRDLKKTKPQGILANTEKIGEFG